MRFLHGVAFVPVALGMMLLAFVCSLDKMWYQICEHKVEYRQKQDSVRLTELSIFVETKSEGSHMCGLVSYQYTKYLLISC